MFADVHLDGVHPRPRQSHLLGVCVPVDGRHRLRWVGMGGLITIEVCTTICEHTRSRHFSDVSDRFYAFGFTIRTCVTVFVLHLGSRPGRNCKV